MHKNAKLGLAIAALAVLLATGCSKGTNAGTGSSSIPLPPSSIPGPVTVSTQPTAGQPKAGRPASCDLNDTWSYAVLEASKGNTLSPTEKTAVNDRLDKASAALKAALPQYATEIESRTQKAKLLIDGKPSDTSPPGNEYDTWYKTTCLT